MSDQLSDQAAGHQSGDGFISLRRERPHRPFGLSVFPDADSAGSDTVCGHGRVVHEIPTFTDESIALAGAAWTINDTIQAIG